MFEEFFGNYLINTGKLSREQFANVKEVMKSTRVKLGLIAVAEKLLTPKQSDEINRLQAVMDKRFGDIAIEKGYLTEEQLSHLLSLQGNIYLQFVQVVTEQGYMSIKEIEAALEQYKSDNSLADLDIAALKSGDVDRIASVFIKSDNAFVNDLLSLAVRNIVRFVSTEITFEKLITEENPTFEHLATQAVKGDHSVLLSFAGNGTSLLSIANPFAKEEFDKIDEDSYDAVCEFINCINGLFASNLSKKNIEIDMEPPLFFDNSTIQATKVYKLPMTISGQSVELVSIFDTEYKIN